MHTLTLSEKLLSVLVAISTRKSLAITEAELGCGFDKSWVKVVREYFYALPDGLTVELGLKRNELCLRAIQSLEIPVEWLETPSDQLGKFTFNF